jgi:hypothetical protein
MRLAVLICSAVLLTGCQSSQPAHEIKTTVTLVDEGRAADFQVAVLEVDRRTHEPIACLTSPAIRCGKGHVATIDKFGVCIKIDWTNDPVCAVRVSKEGKLVASSDVELLFDRAP